MNHLQQTAEQNTVPVFSLPPSLRKAAENKKAIRYIAGAYCRLSRDDGRHKGRSSSIETQQDILAEYAARTSLEVYDTYIDDGWSGTNFDRPAWKSMLDDIEAGRINTIIAKDMSRIGRESTEVGLFLEKYCTEKNVRLIAVSDGIDTLEDSYSEILDILNMYNGWYPKDVSRKTRAAKAIKARQGKFIGSYAPFGYRKSPEDKSVLIPSEDAPLVLEIFRRISQGETVRQVSDDFNARGVITPGVRINTSFALPGRRVPERATWNATTITSILNNLAYIGHLEQSKRRNIGHKGKTRRVTDPDERIIVYNTHEPIVPVELWNAVQNRRTSAPKVQKMKKSGINLFSGFLRCADCGSALAPTVKYLKNGSYTLFRCSRYNNGGSHACSSHTIRYDTLYEIVLSRLRHDSELAKSESEELCDRLYQSVTLEGRRNIKENKTRLTAAQNRQNDIMRRMKQLIEDSWDSKIDADLYDMMMRQYAGEKAELDKEIAELILQVNTYYNAKAQISQWMGLIRQSLEIEELDWSILHELVDCIIIHEREEIDGDMQQQIEIRYKFIGNALNQSISV